MASFMSLRPCDTIEAYFDERMGKEVPEREFDAVAAAMPTSWRGTFPT
jgi:hypothetical protein